MPEEKVEWVLEELNSLIAKYHRMYKTYSDADHLYVAVLSVLILCLVVALELGNSKLQVVILITMLVIVVLVRGHYDIPENADRFMRRAIRLESQRYLFFTRTKPYDQSDKENMEVLLSEMREIESGIQDPDYSL